METLDFIKKKYNIDAAQSSPVYLKLSRWSDLPLLFNELGFLKGAEIGVYRGRYSELIKKYNPNLELWSVDAWTIYPGYKDFGNHDIDDAYEEAKQRSEKSGFKLIKGWSLDAVKNFEDNSLDFVFIDGNHDFRHVTDDIDEWSRKVRKGGIVSGHDFFINHHKGFGVREAVPAWCSAYGISPLIIFSKDKCPSWMYVK